MTGIVTTVTLTGLPALERRLELLARMDIAPLRDEIGALVESQTRRRIDEEKQGPDHKAWPAWGPNWAGSRHRGHSLLENEGDLLDSIHFVVSGHDILVGTNLVYGAIHQFGGAEVGIPIPARPYLGLSDDNTVELIDQVDAFINRVLQ
ncbi:MAG: phage virion morphogenesis protein [Magnetospirillum sp.]|nr:MAG: phage virion morphogenesis protein [Magnetospirillum sp.]